MDFELLKRLCDAPGISGREDAVRVVAAEELAGLVDSLDVDVMGNLIARRNGAAGGPRVMITAHLDGLGFRVRAVDDRGFLRLQPHGNWDPRSMFAQRVRVYGREAAPLPGTLMPALKPRHTQTAEDEARQLQIDDFFVDIGMHVDKVRSQVEIGDMVTMDRTCERMGDMVVSKTLDDRVGLAIMIEALRALKGRSLAATVVAVATTQEEIGLRGAQVAAYNVDPDIGIALDVTLAVDIPGTDEANRVTALRGGTALKICDSAVVCNPKLVRHFRDIAEARGIKHQLEILPRGGTEAGPIQRTRGGVAALTLSTPTRYIHTVNETAHVEDIQAGIDLLAAYLEEAHTRSYGFTLKA